MHIVKLDSACVWSEAFWLNNVVIFKTAEVDLVQPGQGAVEVDLDPTWSRSDVLTMILHTIPLHER